MPQKRDRGGRNVGSLRTKGPGEEGAPRNFVSEWGGRFRVQISLWLLWKEQSTILALFGRRVLGQYPVAPSSPGPFVLLPRGPCETSWCLAAKIDSPLSRANFLTLNCPRPNCLLKCLPNCLSPTIEDIFSSFKITPVVRVIARQLSGKNCLAAIFASRHQDASTGPFVLLLFGSESGRNQVDCGKGFRGIGAAGGRARWKKVSTSPTLGKRKHAPPCSSAELFFAEKKMGSTEERFRWWQWFPGFYRFLYPPPAWKVVLWGQKSSAKDFLSVVVVYAFFWPLLTMQTSLQNHHPSRKACQRMANQLSGPISRDIAILSLPYLISPDTFSGRLSAPQNGAIPLLVTVSHTLSFFSLAFWISLVKFKREIPLLISVFSPSFPRILWVWQRQKILDNR